MFHLHQTKAEHNRHKDLVARRHVQRPQHRQGKNENSQVNSHVDAHRRILLVCQITTGAARDGIPEIRDGAALRHEHGEEGDAKGDDDENDCHRPFEKGRSLEDASI